MISSSYGILFGLLLFLAITSMILDQQAFAGDPGLDSVKITEGQGGFEGDLDADNLFGPSAAIGDLNGDGVQDLAVGAFADNAVWILFMNDDGTVSDEVKISGDDEVFGGGVNEVIGLSVSGIGDINDDGVLDVLVGDLGSVWVLLMNKDGTVSEAVETDADDAVFGGEAEGTFFGTSIAGIDDLDGDGVEDIAVGDPLNDEENGVVWILFMNKDGTVSDVVPIAEGEGGFEGDLNGELFGVGLAKIGDLNGDGVEDLAVGEPFDSDAGSDTFAAGAIWILLMNDDGTVDDEVKITDGVGGFGEGTLSDDAIFGETIVGVGDIDGDGIPDIAVSAPGDATVWLLAMNDDGTVADEFAITGGIIGEEVVDSDAFGGSLFALLVVEIAGGSMGAADINGDGGCDLAAGVTGDDDAGDDVGALYVIFLGGSGPCFSWTLAPASGGGDNNHDKTPPSFGVLPNGKRFIDDGFTYNGISVDIDNWFTHVPIILAETGQPNLLTLKFYDNDDIRGIRVIGTHFGVPNVGATGEAIVLYSPNLNVPLEVVDPNNLVNVLSIPTITRVPCNSNSYRDDCLLFTLEHSFNDAPISNIVRVTIVDSDGRYATVHFNEGIQVVGESLNPPVTETIVIQGKPPQLVEITQVDRFNNLWQDPNENIWTQNLYGNWIKLTVDEYVIPIDPVGSNGYERVHTYFAMYKIGQELYAKQIWDSSEIQSELPDYTAWQPKPQPTLRADDADLQSMIQSEVDIAEELFAKLFPGIQHNFEN